MKFIAACIFILSIILIPLTHAEFIWGEDFEDGSYTDSFAWNGNTSCEGGAGLDAASIINHHERQGELSLRYDACEAGNDPITGNPGCANIFLQFGDWGSNTIFGTPHPINESVNETKELYVKYWLRYENDNDPAKDFMWHFYATFGNYVLGTGHVDFLAEPVSGFGKPSTIRTFTSSIFGFFSTIHDNDMDMPFIRDGNWHKMEFFVDYDSTGDGSEQSLVRAWVDDTLVYENTNAGLSGLPDMVRISNFVGTGVFYDDCTSSPVQIDDFEIWNSMPTTTVCDDGAISSACECGGSWRESGYCFAGEVWNADSTPTCAPQTEICNDGIDNDCDGYTDSEDMECSSGNIECNETTITIAARNNYILYFNDRYVGHGNNTVTSYTAPLRAGTNIIAVNAFSDNSSQNETFALEAEMCGEHLISDTNWKVTENKPLGWKNQSHDASGWSTAISEAWTVPAGFNYNPEAITSPYDPAQGDWSVGWFREEFVINELAAPILPSITGSHINASTILVGKNITIEANASDHTTLALNLTQPDATTIQIALDSGVSEHITLEQTGSYTIVFIAQNENGTDTDGPYTVETLPSMNYHVRIVNEQGNGISSTLQARNNGTLWINKVGTGNYSGQTADQVYNLSINAYDSYVQVFINDVDISEEQEISYGISQLDDDNYERAYGFSNITPTHYYISYSNNNDEEYYTPHYCNNWNFSSQHCSQWNELSENFSQDQGNNKFIFTTSATAIALALDVPEDDDDDNGGGGGGGGSSDTTTTQGTRFLIGTLQAGEQRAINIEHDRIYINRLVLRVTNTSYVDLRIAEEDEVPEHNFTAIQNISIDVDLDEEELDKVTMYYEIPLEVLEDYGLQAEEIALYRYTEQWDKLETEIVRKDNTTTYFQSRSPGFSYFSIGGEQGSYTAAEETNEEENESEEELLTEEESIQENITQQINTTSWNETSQQSEEEQGIGMVFGKIGQIPSYMWILISLPLIAVLATIFIGIYIYRDRRKQQAANTNEETVQNNTQQKP